MAKRGSGNKARVPMYRERPPNCEQCVFNIDIETCGACVGAMKVIACIEDPAVMPKALAVLAGQALKQILDHLKHKAETGGPKALPESRTPPVGQPHGLFD
jgi:hypothetical protein